MLQESFAHASDDVQARALAEARVDADRIIGATRDGARGRCAICSTPTSARRSTARSPTSRRLRDGDDRAALAKAVEALNRATGEFAARRMDRGVARALAGKRIDALG